jgi:hypothetical protein
LDAATAAELQEQGASQQDIDVQPQNRCVVGEKRAPAIFSFNVTTFGPSVEKNHLKVCTELQRPWQEDMESMEAQRVQHNKQKAEQYQQLKTEQPGPGAYAAMLGQKARQKAEQYQQLKTEQPVAHALARAAMKEQRAEQYQQFKTEQPKAYAAMLEQRAPGATRRAAESRKKKKKKKPPCPGSVHGPAQPCTVAECNTIWCHSK